MHKNWPTGWLHQHELPEADRKPWSFSEEPGGPDGDRIERFEVHPGDGSADDKRRGKDRCEKIQCGPRLKADVTDTDNARQYEGDEYWYRWKFSVPENWIDSGNKAGTSRLVHLSQFLQTPDPARPDDWEPAFMFGKRADVGPFCLWTFPLDRTKGKVPTEVWRQCEPLLQHEDFAGKWHEVVVHAIWSQSGGGLFKVWINGSEKYKHEGPTISPGNCNVFHKYGIYRATTPDNPVDCVACFSGMRRGRTSAEVTSTILSNA